MELPGGMDELLRSPDYSADPECIAGFGSYLYVLWQLWPGELRPTGRLRYALRAAGRRTLYTGIALLCARRQWRPQGLGTRFIASALYALCHPERSEGSALNGKEFPLAKNFDKNFEFSVQKLRNSLDALYKTIEAPAHMLSPVYGITATGPMTVPSLTDTQWQPLEVGQLWGLKHGTSWLMTPLPVVPAINRGRSAVGASAKLAERVSIPRPTPIYRPSEHSL